jgi:hypothetical protein
MSPTQRETIKQTVTCKYEMMADHLNEKTRRLWAASEALAIGRGGITLVAQAIGMSRTTIHNGIAEVQTGELAPDRIRRPGGGRKAITATDNTLSRDLERLIDPATRGDPESSLRWTSKSLMHLTEALVRSGHVVSHTTIHKLLRAAGFSLQANRKTREGIDHPDRDRQFHYISDTVRDFQQRSQPVISVDTKKKELVGNFKNTGQEWEKTRQPVSVNMHDFPEQHFGKVIPYGIYDLTQNEGWMNVGITHDTAEFAVAGIKNWWKQLGKQRYPDATELLITADCGGSNGRRVRLWKQQLQHFADETGLTVHVRHFPPGTSKWNKIEHRLFSFVTKNWRGRPLIDRATVINLLGNVTTQAGLKVYAALDYRMYPTGIKVSAADMRQLNHIPEDWHGEWNYRFEPSGHRPR